jgi:phosphohistidine phosphatase
MGAYMAKQSLSPDHVLCSPAVRARQTLDLVLPHLAGGPTVVYEDTFYLSAPSELLGRLRKIKAKVHHVLVIGHDPAMQGLALDLAGDGPSSAVQALVRKFPTGALAVLKFKVRHWSSSRPARAR